MLEHGFQEPEAVTPSRSNYTCPAAFPTQTQHRVTGEKPSSCQLVLKKLPFTYSTNTGRWRLSLCMDLSVWQKGRAAPLAKLIPKGWRSRHRASSLKSHQCAALLCPFLGSVWMTGTEKHCGCLRCHEKNQQVQRRHQKKDREKEEQDAGSYFTQVTSKRESPDTTIQRISQDSPSCLKYKRDSK